jgi:hypothetical protein
MKTLVPAAMAVALALALAACAGPSRDEPQSQGSVLNPVCLPDGSVAYNQLANADGTFGNPQASFANCPWNKPK